MATLSEFSVPERYRSGLLSLASLDNVSFDQLDEALSKVSPAFFPPKLLRDLTQAVGTIEQNILDAILTAVLSVYRLTEALHRSADEVAALLSHSSDLPLDEDGRMSLEKRAGKLLKSPTIVVTSKAVSILTANEKSFSQARIVSEIRPIFVDGVGQGPAAAVLVHMLSITYRKAPSDFQEVHIALDSQDVNALASILKRANDKAEALQSVLDRAGLKLLDPAGESK